MNGKTALTTVSRYGPSRNPPFILLAAVNRPRRGPPVGRLSGARLQILGVIREDIGTGRDYKQASTDAFKRAAVRFGIAHELYAYEQNWVEMDGDGKYAKPVEDPQLAYVRRCGRPGPAPIGASTNGGSLPAVPTSLLTDIEVVGCPKCGGPMWDNRLTKRNPKAPDYKCQNRSCDGVIWPGMSSLADLTEVSSPEIGSRSCVPVITVLACKSGTRRERQRSSTCSSS